MAKNPFRATSEVAATVDPLVESAVPVTVDSLPEAPAPEQRFDYQKISDNLYEAGACLQSLAADAQKNGYPDKAQNLRDRADLELDNAQFLRALVGIVVVPMT